MKIFTSWCGDWNRRRNFGSLPMRQVPKDGNDVLDGCGEAPVFDSFGGVEQFAGAGIEPVD